MNKWHRKESRFGDNEIEKREKREGGTEKEITIALKLFLLCRKYKYVNNLFIRWLIINIKINKKYY